MPGPSAAGRLIQQAPVTTEEGRVAEALMAQAAQPHRLDESIVRSRESGIRAEWRFIAR